MAEAGTSRRGWLQGVSGESLARDAMAGLIASVVVLAFALLVTFVSLTYGYIPGVLLGLAGACLLFAISYSRVGLIKRHATRATFSSDVDHGPEASIRLTREGEAIHIYWLSGYIFFGSADVVFERARASIATAGATPVRYVLLDFHGVTGADATAVMGLLKLRGLADKHGITLVFAGLGEQLRRSLRIEGFFAERSRHRHFPTRQAALEWCETELLEERREKVSGLTQREIREEEDRFVAWMLSELGPGVKRELFTRYFERRSLSEAGDLYVQGTAADAIDLVVSGTVTISFRDSDGRTQRLRCMRRRTVVGEMASSAPVRARRPSRSTGPWCCSPSRASVSRP